MSLPTTPAVYTVRERDKYGRSCTRYRDAFGATAAIVVKVPRESRWIVANWVDSTTADFSVRRDAAAYAERITAQVTDAYAAAPAPFRPSNVDEDGYTFCPDGECGACDNTGLACSNPANPETGGL